MKKLLKLVFAILLIAGFTSESKAQINIGAQAGIALPMETPFSDSQKMGFGGLLEGNYFVTENISLGVNVGYYTFSGKEVGGFEMPNFYMTPIIVKGDYYINTSGFMPYGGVSLGMYMLGSAEKTIGGITIPSSSDSKFGFSPHLGFLTGEDIKFGAEAAYNFVSDANYLNFNLKVVFPLGE
jgi:hypothetical protein